MSSYSLANELSKTVLLLVSALPFLVPFTLGRNIDLQGLTVILTGALAWLAVGLRLRQESWRPKKWVTGLLVVYLVSCLLSLLTHRLFVNVIGGQLMRIGDPALVAVVGIGLAMKNIEVKRLISYLYGTCVALAVLSIAYIPAALHDKFRLGGVFHQADFLAVFMAIGLLLGVAILQLYPKLNMLSIIGQGLLAVILLLTGTRAVIALLLLVGLVLLLRSSLLLRRKLAIVVASLLIVSAGIVITQNVLLHRLTSGSLASSSLQYRLDLQHFGLKAAEHQPFFGYGPGNLDKPLACSTLHNPALQQTCHQGFYFDSSHNVYLDRVLALGWVGGLSFTVFVGYSLLVGWRRTGYERYFWYLALLIALYYLTNPTNLEIEAIFWISSLQLLQKTSRASA